ncbi:MAG: hypothetical protein ACRDH0_06095 [Actinomycetota bacterium]
MRVEPIHDRVDEHPFVPFVLEQDHSEAFAKLKLLFADAIRAADAAPQIHLGPVRSPEIVPDVRSAIRVRRRIFNRSHGLKASAKSVRGCVPTLSIRGKRSINVDELSRNKLGHAGVPLLGAVAGRRSAVGNLLRRRRGRHMVKHLKPPVLWLKSYWEDQDILFYFEFDEDGWVLRQVELQGPMRTPIAAAALSEWPDAGTDGLDAVRQYAARYGGLAEHPMPTWPDPDFPHQDISADEFEDVWRSARATLDETA